MYFFVRFKAWYYFVHTRNVAFIKISDGLYRDVDGLIGGLVTALGSSN